MVSRTKITIYQRLKAAREGAHQGGVEHETLANATARCVTQLLGGSVDEGATQARQWLSEAVAALQRACGDVIADVPLCRGPWLVTCDAVNRHVDEARACITQATRCSVVVKTLTPVSLVKGLTKGNLVRASKAALGVVNRIRRDADRVWRELDEGALDELIATGRIGHAVQQTEVEEAFDLREVIARRMEALQNEIGANFAEGKQSYEEVGKGGEMTCSYLCEVKKSIQERRRVEEVNGVRRNEVRDSGDDVGVRTSVRRVTRIGDMLGVKQRHPTGVSGRVRLWQRGQRSALLGLQ